MINIVLGYDEFVGNYVASRIKDVADATEFAPYRAIGFANEDRQLVGGVVYYNFTQDDIFANIAIDDRRCLTRQNLFTIFAYPFLDQDVHRITVLCARANKRARNLAQKLGFRQEGVIKQAINRKQDAIIYGLLKADCKWIKRYGQEVSADATEAA